MACTVASREGCPISIGFRIGSFACSSRLGARPSRNSVWKKSAFRVVGALRRPSWPSMPSETERWSVKPRLTSWQTAQATVPSRESRVSK
jgi:hypothetical protein